MTGPGDEMAGGDRLRASHADREQVIEVLKAAFVQGRLAKDEFDARVGQVFTARTYAELTAVTADLPAGLVTARPREPARVRPSAIATVGALTVLTAGLWAAALSANSDNGALDILVLSLTLAWLGSLILTGAVTLESRRRKRSGGQLPPAPGGDGPVFRRPGSAALAEPLPPIDHGQQHTAEAARLQTGEGCGCSAGSRSSGRRMANLVMPGRLVTMMQPPCAATTASTMARPRPVLFPAALTSRARPVSPRVNRSNSSGSSSGAMPGPSSVMLSSTRGPVGAMPRCTAAVPSVVAVPRDAEHQVRVRR